MHEMQHKAQKNFDASRDRSLPVFGVGVAFIDESSISSVPCDEVAKAIQDLRSIVSNLTPPNKELHVVPIGSICSSDSDGESERLKRLLDAVSDATGKEDLLLHLRMLSLQKVCLYICNALQKAFHELEGKYNTLIQNVRFTFSAFIVVQIASEKGYNRLVLGSCTSRIACHVILATVKVRFQ